MAAMLIKYCTARSLAGWDVHLRQEGMEHDPATGVVLPDREFVVAEAALEFLDMLAADIENDPDCLHRLTLLGLGNPG
jgi:hypothetical protein